MAYRLISTPHFERRLKKFRQSHPDLSPRVEGVFRDLRLDPFQPGLRLHPLRGELAGLHAVSVTYAYRNILILRLDDNNITLLDIGGHDMVYR
ncbi:MAG TPA: hypothetical protein VKU87_09700 [Thermomicrobiaceae bacterium]|nr:hypothetical protein [Thermomicrobiaceae bacterium]